MKWLKFLAVILLITSLTGCKGKDTVKTTEDFIAFAEGRGISFEVSPYYSDSGDKLFFQVEPGNMTIAFIETDSVKAAKQEVSLNNQDYSAVEKAVRRDGTPLCEMADSPKAFRNGNLVMYVPVGYILFYPESEPLIEIFNNF